VALGIFEVVMNVAGVETVPLIEGTCEEVDKDMSLPLVSDIADADGV